MATRSKCVDLRIRVATTRRTDTQAPELAHPLRLHRAHQAEAASSARSSPGRSSRAPPERRACSRAAAAASPNAAESSPGTRPKTRRSIALSFRASTGPVKVHAASTTISRAGDPARASASERAEATKRACVMASSSPGVASFGNGSPSGSDTGSAWNTPLSASMRALPAGGRVSQETVPRRTTLASRGDVWSFKGDSFPS